MTAKQQQSFNEDGSPRRKYELEDKPESRFGVSTVIGLVFASGLVLLKNVLFGESALSEPAPNGREPAHKPSKPIEPNLGKTESLAAVVPEEEEDKLPDEPKINKAIGSGSASSLFPPEDSYYPENEIGPPRNAAFMPAPGNDNEALYGATPGAGIDLTQAGGGGGSSGGSKGPSSSSGSGVDPAEQDDDDDDNTPRSNRLPVVTAPVILADLVSNQSVVLTLSDFLRNAVDPDGDALRVRNLVASSGSLVARDDGSWIFTPDTDDTTAVTFRYAVSDGIGQTLQFAHLDLVPPATGPIVGTNETNTIIGTPRDDVIDARDGDDTVIGREGNDVIYGSGGHDRLLGGDGNDVIYGGDGNDTIFGGAGRDRLFGDKGNDIIFGGADDDIIDGGDGNDTLHGEEDNDTILGGTGDDDIEGGPGKDTLVPGEGKDNAKGGADDDTFIATANDDDDTYDGGSGSDTYDISATNANARIDLANGNATSSDIGSDALTSIENANGGSGSDTMIASTAINVLRGGAGNDVFVFQSTLAMGLGRGYRDKILDFAVGDRIDLDQISDEFEERLDETFEDHGIKRFLIIEGQDEFTRPGQMRLKYDNIDGHDVTVLQGSIDFNADVDFELELAGICVLKEDDFYGHG